MTIIQQAIFHSVFAFVIGTVSLIFAMFANEKRPVNSNDPASIFLWCVIASFATGALSAASLFMVLFPQSAS